MSDDFALSHTAKTTNDHARTQNHTPTTPLLVNDQYHNTTNNSDSRPGREYSEAQEPSLQGVVRRQRLRGLRRKGRLALDTGFQ